MKVEKFLNFILSLTCFFRVTTILFIYLNPEQTNVRRYEKNLQDIEFPVSLKLCFYYEDEYAFFYNLGYKNVWKFFVGQSVFDTDLFGWHGHTANNETLFQSSTGKTILKVDN